MADDFFADNIKFIVIIVSYNAGQSLISTYESLRGQTHRNIELIIKDGASTDGSLSVLQDKYAGDEILKNSRIISEKDEGIYDAMNEAISAIPESDLTSDRECSFVYFLNCGDSFADNEVLERVAKGISEKFEDDRNNKKASKDDRTRLTIFYGDIIDMQTGQHVSSPPVIDDFACYRNVPCHQSAFYDVALMKNERFDIKWRVRADYEHFLRCRYIENADTIYLDTTIAKYEGGGFSETAENRRISEQERKKIIAMYLTPDLILKFDIIRWVTLAPLRTYLASNKSTAGAYNKFRSWLYKLLKGKKG
ncbi:MAG: glycosyltransferase [Butyrivibrio sp.]|nr:glycosyltransferase [Butyrivibrio sp.]